MSAIANSPLERFARNAAMALLGAVALGLGFFAWLQHEELAALRTQVSEYQLHPAIGKKNHLTDAGAGPADAAMEESSDASDGRDGGKKKHKERADGSIKPKAKETSGWRAYANLVGNPEFEKLSAAQNRALAARTYAPLMKNLNLPPETQSKLVDLLGARQQAVTDAVVAARETGLKSKNAPGEFSQATAQAAAPVDAEIQQLLGSSAFSQLQQFQAVIPEQNLVGQLQQRLSTGAAPLSNEQAALLLQKLTEAKTADGSVLGTHSLLAGGGVAKITDSTLTAAQQVLTPAQVQELVQIQQERAQQSELDKLMKGKSTTPGTKTAGKK